MQRTQSQLAIVAWAVSLAVVALAFLAWSTSYQSQISSLGTYDIFPLLGLLAFSLMWVHYVMGAVRRYLGIERSTLMTFFRYTSYAVLVLILLHPGLLIFQLWLDGYGLPPFSYLNYVPPALQIYVIFGTVSLMAFLAYELRPWFEGRSWWKWVVAASDIAMILIFFHALNLGGQLQSGWYRAVWMFYGITLGVVLAYNYLAKLQRKPVQAISQK